MAGPLKPKPVFNWSELSEFEKQIKAKEPEVEPDKIRHKPVWTNGTYAVIWVDPENPLHKCYRTLSFRDRDKCINLPPGDGEKGIMLRGGISSGYVKVRVRDLQGDDSNEFGDIAL